MALLLDFYFDIEYLNQISLYTSRNIMDKHIQINNGALIVVAIWDIFSFFTIPLTCMIVFQMSFTPNLKKNLIGEVVLLNIRLKIYHKIISLSYSLNRNSLFLTNISSEILKIYSTKSVKFPTLFYKMSSNVHNVVKSPNFSTLELDAVSCIANY